MVLEAADQSKVIEEGPHGSNRQKAAAGRCRVILEGLLAVFRVVQLETDLLGGQDRGREGGRLRERQKSGSETQRAREGEATERLESI